MSANHPPGDLNVIAESSAGFYPGRWVDYLHIRGARMTNGRLAAVQVDGDIALMFATREEGPQLVYSKEDLLRAGAVKSGLNTVVEVVAKDGARQVTMCFVAPRGRIRQIFAGVGHPLDNTPQSMPEVRDDDEPPADTLSLMSGKTPSAAPEAPYAAPPKAPGPPLDVLGLAGGGVSNFNGGLPPAPRPRVPPPPTHALNLMSGTPPLRPPDETRISEPPQSIPDGQPETSPAATPRPSPAHDEERSQVSSDDRRVTTDEEIEARKKALRYRLIEAFEGLGWDVRLQGGNIILGNGRAHLQPLVYDRVLIYVPITTPSFSPDEVNGLNADMDFAAFFSDYQTEGGGTSWGGFLRVSLPEGEVETDQLGRWLEAQVLDVLAATRVFDDAIGEDEG